MLKCFADLKHVIVEVPGTTESAHPFLLNLHVSLFPREVINLQPLFSLWGLIGWNWLKVRPLWWHFSVTFSLFWAKKSCAIFFSLSRIKLLTFTPLCLGENEIQGISTVASVDFILISSYKNQASPTFFHWQHLISKMTGIWAKLPIWTLVLLWGGVDLTDFAQVPWVKAKSTKR